MKGLLRVITLAMLFLFYKFARPFLKKQGVVILLYHSIADTSWSYAVAPEVFERHVRYLKAHHRLLPLSEVVAALEKNASLPRGVVITFDDGYRDFLLHALPVLERYEVPATLFVCTGEVDRKELGNDFDLLRRGEYRELARHPLVTLGSHGMTHRKLTRLSMDEAKNEIESSRVLIHGETAMEPHVFAYPKGSFNRGIETMVERAGYRAAVTASLGLVEYTTGRYAIPRVLVDRSTSFFEFRAKLTPVAGWYAWLWRRVFD